MEKHRRSNQHRRFQSFLFSPLWTRAVAGFAAIVIFFTTYWLMLPASALTKNAAADVSGLSLEQSGEILVESEEAPEDPTQSEQEEPAAITTAENADSVPGPGAGNDGSVPDGSVADSSSGWEQIPEAEQPVITEETTPVAGESATSDGAIADSVAAPSESQTKVTEDANASKNTEAEVTETSGGTSAETEAGADAAAESGAEDGVNKEGAVSETESPDTEEETTETEELSSEESEEEDEEEEEVFGSGELLFRGNNYSVTIEYGEDAKIPDTAELRVRELEEDSEEYQAHYETAKNNAKENGAQVRTARFFDITIVSPEKNADDVDEEVWREIEPAAQVKVNITFDKEELELPEKTEVEVLHFADENNAETVEKEKVEVETSESSEGTAVSGVGFDADAFSVFGVVGTGPLTVDYLTEEGSTYEITVDLSEVTNVPKDAYLDIRELVGDEYNQYLKSAAIALDKDVESIKKAKLFDIAIKNGDDEIEPNGKVNVEIVLKDDSFEDAAIVHFGDETEVIEAATEGNSISFETSSFSVYAVIDGSADENARAAVEFYNGGTKIATMYIKNSDILLGDGERRPDVSYIEDIVVDPGVGTVEGDELFRGWTTNAGYTVADASSAMTIEGVREYLAENIIGTITEGVTVKIYAMIYKYFDVTYYGLDEGVSLGSDTVLRLRNETQAAYQVSMPFTAESNAKFMGWKAIEGTYRNIVGATDPETVYPNTTNITITDDVVFKVYAPTGHWLVYNENAKGATYNAPGFFLDDEDTVQPATATADNMHRNGYRFDGWYKLKDGQELTDADKDEDGNYIIGDKFETFTFGHPLEPVVTNIYAKWTPNTQAPYTIVFWTENIDSINSAQADKVYDLTASYTGTGTVGQNIPYTFINNGDEDYVRAGGSDYHYTGFSLIPGSINQQVTITPEGDAVLNLYYNRIKYDLRFYLYRRNGRGVNDYQFARNSASGNNVWGIVDWYNSTIINDMPTTTYPGGIHNESGIGGNNITGYYIVLSAYYGEDISDRWPTYDLIGTGSSGSTNYSPVSYVMMVGTKLKPRPSDQGDGTLKGVYNRMDENILGLTNDADGNFLIVRFNRYNDWTYHCYYEAYDGQDLTGKTTRRLNGKTYYLDHDFISRSSNTLPASQNPPQYAGFTAVMQSGSDSRPYYDQVYIDGVLNGSPQANSVYNHDAQLNYYYDRKKYPIHYMDGIYVGGNDNTNILGSHPDQELHTSENIPYDADIPDNDKSYKPDPSLANEPGFVFEGWYADAACKVPYDFTKMPDNPIVVYAKWVQIQYRVFLHPNAEDSTTNPNLNWGSENQQMNFRVAYGDKVSTPTGIWTNGRKEFVAWFTDETCQNEVFDGDVFVLNEETVKATYDKTDPSNFTDDMDQWGNGATYNNDTERWWITKKLDVYAKWRTVLVGADGINVVYVAQGTDATDPETTVPGTVNGSETYWDPLKYLDNAGAVAGQAAVPVEAGKYQFLHWVLQKWDAEEEEYVDVTNENGELVTVYPGDSFTVLEEYARIIETEPDDPTTPDVIETRRTYTVQLRAEYAPKELAKPTYINWFKNDSDPSVLLHEDKDLQINEATKIYTVVDDNPIPTREGYKFLGWAREPEYDLGEDGKPIPETQHTAYLDLTEDDLYLKYVEPTETTAAGYQAKNKEGTWVNVTQVAADEAVPYHAMYAVWKPLTNLNVRKYDDAETPTPINLAWFKLLLGSEEIAGEDRVSGYTGEHYETLGYCMENGENGLTYTGLQDGVYSLVETKAPDGYIITNSTTTLYVHGGTVYTKREGEEGSYTYSDPLTKSQDEPSTYYIDIINEPGVALPSTGGPGTRTFTILGGMMIALAGALLLQKRRFL